VGEPEVRPAQGPRLGRPIDSGSYCASYHGQKPSNATHQSVRDTDARMARRISNPSSVLAYEASGLVDNRHYHVVNTSVSSPSGRAEVEDAVYL